MSAVYEEKALTEKALLKHLDGKADGKKVAKAEKKVVVFEEAVVSECGSRTCRNGRLRQRVGACRHRGIRRVDPGLECPGYGLSHGSIVVG